MCTWNDARDLLAERLRARARFWREKARTDLKAHPDSCLLRAQECEACADVAEHLKYEYTAPSKPDMKSARASRNEGR